MLEYALCYLYRYQSATRINLFDITLRYLMIRFKNFGMKGLQKSYSELYIFYTNAEILYEYRNTYR